MLSSRIQLLDPKAAVPTRAHESDTGYDLTFVSVKQIEGDVIFFGCGFAVEPPEGHYFEVVPRSSISKLPIEMANSIGVIDEHYRGEIIVPVRVNHAENGMGTSKGTFPNGIAHILGYRPTNIQDMAFLILRQKPVLFQMILREKLSSTFEVVQSLTETRRGSGGFGSTDEANWQPRTITTPQEGLAISASAIVVNVETSNPEEQPVIANQVVTENPGEKKKTRGWRRANVEVEDDSP